MVGPWANSCPAYAGTVVTPEQVTAALATVDDPEIRRPITELGMVESVADRRRTVGRRVGILLTVAGCPLRDKLTTDVTAAVSAVPGVTAVRVDFGVMSRRAAHRRCSSRCAGSAPEPVIPFAQPGSRTRVYAVASGKGGVGKSSVTVNLGGRAGRPGPVGRRRRRRHLRALRAAHARRHRPADPGRGHDHAAAGARREGHLDRNVHRRQRRGGLARADAAPGAAAVPGRRVLGRPRRAAARPAAGHRATSRSRSPSCCRRPRSSWSPPRRWPRRRWPSGPGRSRCRPTSALLGVVENMSWLELPDGERMELFGSGGGASRGRVADAAHRRPGAAAGSDPDRPAGTRGRRRGRADRAVSAGLAGRGRARRVADKLAARQRGLAGLQLGLCPADPLTPATSTGRPLGPAGHRPSGRHVVAHPCGCRTGPGSAVAAGRRRCRCRRRGCFRRRGWWCRHRSCRRLGAAPVGTAPVCWPPPLVPPPPPVDRRRHRRRRRRHRRHRRRRRRRRHRRRRCRRRRRRVPVVRLRLLRHRHDPARPERGLDARRREVLQPAGPARRPRSCARPPRSRTSTRTSRPRWSGPPGRPRSRPPPPAG